MWAHSEGCPCVAPFGLTICNASHFSTMPTFADDKHVKGQRNSQQLHGKETSLVPEIGKSCLVSPCVFLIATWFLQTVEKISSRTVGFAP